LEFFSILLLLSKDVSLGAHTDQLCYVMLKKIRETTATAHSLLVDIFCHVRQVAARVLKLVLEGAFGTPIWGEGRS